MGVKKLSAFAGAAALLAMLFTGIAAAPASAAPIESSCGYAAPDGGGKFPDSICWFDFTGYDPAVALTTAGQQFEMSLGAYDVSYTVTQRPVGLGWSERSVVAASAAAPSPFVIGTPGYYNGIPGLPFLYATAGQPSGAVQINITDFQISLNGTPVTGYDLVSAAPETTDAAVGQFGEFLNWKSDVPLRLIDSLPIVTTGGGCGMPLIGDGTTDVWCYPGASGSTSAYGSILAAPSATTISGSVYMYTRGEREALGFGIRTASVSVDKQVASRVDPLDSFDLSVTSSEGPILDSATTGATDAATTDVIPVIPSGPLTLAEAATSGAPSPLGYYDAAWSCTNANAASTTVLPTGAAASQQLALVAGDAVSCTVTNTAKAASLDLVKSVAPATAAAGDTVVYSFAVTNDGALPVEDLTIDETAFSGTGELDTIDCPTTELAVDASTTCTASYVVTQADIDAGLVTNEATAAAQVTGTSAIAASAASTAALTTGGESALVVAKTVDKASATVGDDVVYTLTATNTGALTLTDVTLTDQDFSGSVPLAALTCDQPAPVTLAPGDVLTCAVSYEVRAADVGTLTNGVIGTAVDPDDNTLIGSDSAAVTVTAVAAGASLAITGANAPWVLVGTALVLLLAGIAVVSIRRMRRS